MINLTELKPQDVLRRFATRSPKSRAISGAALALAVAAAVTLFTTRVATQDLGELARRERAKKQSENAPARHVYTNDDLAKREILSPEDRNRYTAARTPAPDQTQTQAASTHQPEATAPQSGTAAGVPTVTSAGNAANTATLAQVGTGATALFQSGNFPAEQPTLEQMPLGDVARFYRAQQKNQEKMVASAKPAAPPASKSLFPLPQNATPLASMKRAIPVAPTRAAATTPSKTPINTPIKTPTNAPINTPAKAPVQPVDKIIVAPGTTLWSIARIHLGSGFRWKEIVAINPGLEDPRQLRAGSEIKLPPSKRASL